jgi:hypothetical protein
MGYKADGFVIRMKCYADAEAVKQWLTTEVVVDTLLAPLAADGYLGRATHVSHDFAPPEPIHSMAELRRRAAAWRYGIVSLFAGDPADPEFEIFLGLEPVGPRFAVAVAGADPRFRDDVARWVRTWSHGLAAARVRFATGRFEPARATYPRPTPPRTSLDWPPGSLDQYLGRAWHRADAECAAVLEALEQAPLPQGASRIIDRDVVHIAFATDLQDAAAVAAARSAHERWITPLVQAPPERGWNEHGDGAVGALSSPRLRVVEGMTFYNDETQVGHQALVVFPDGSIEEDRWAAAEAIARAGALPDGTPVKSVRLIFPRRADALAMHARALAAGFEMTTYGDGPQLWQVYPPPP